MSPFDTSNDFLWTICNTYKSCNDHVVPPAGSIPGEFHSFGQIVVGRHALLVRCDDGLVHSGRNRWIEGDVMPRGVCHFDRDEWIVVVSLDDL